MKTTKIRRMVGVAILAAIVVVLQSVGSFIRFGSVSVSLVLIPIVVGAAMYGPGAGAVLGGSSALSYCFCRILLSFTVSILAQLSLRYC